jgi:hypothetical protein
MINLEERGRGYPCIYLKGPTKTTRNLSQDSRLLDPYSNLGPSEYEARLLTTTPVLGVIL